MLRGAVPTVEQRSAAEQIASSAPGVTWAENHIEVAA